MDFVIEADGRLLPIEVKAAARVAPPDARALETFLDEYPGRTQGALLLYGALTRAFSPTVENPRGYF